MLGESCYLLSDNAADPRSVSGSHLIANADHLQVGLDCLAHSFSLPPACTEQVVALYTARPANTEGAVNHAAKHLDLTEPYGSQWQAELRQPSQNAAGAPSRGHYNSAAYKPVSHIAHLPSPPHPRLRAGPPPPPPNVHPTPPFSIAMSDPSTSAPSVRLPQRRGSDAVGSNKPPVWSINESASSQPAPLPAKCDRHEPGRSGVCCKELRGDDERTLIDPDVVRDV